MAVQRFFSRALTDDGSATGSEDMAQDFSSNPTEFYIQPRAGEREIFVASLIVYYQASMNGNATDYGGGMGQTAPLENGISIWHMNDSGMVVDLTNGNPIKSNAGWGAITDGVTRTDWGTGDDVYRAEWRFVSELSLFAIGNDDGDRFGVTLSDDFSALTMQSFRVQGFHH